MVAMICRAVGMSTTSLGLRGHAKKSPQNFWHGLPKIFPRRGVRGDQAHHSRRVGASSLTRLEDHLYAASRLEDNILKIGVSKDVMERMPELSRSFQAGYAFQRVWPGEAALEELVLEKLKPFKAAVGNSREHLCRIAFKFHCKHFTSQGWDGS